MNPRDLIERLLELTDDLSDALTQDDLERCAALLADREQTWQQLMAAGGLPDGAEGAACAEALRLLRQRDLDLEESCQAHLSTIGSELSRLRRSGPADTSHQQPLCVDKKV